MALTDPQLKRHVWPMIAEAWLAFLRTQPGAVNSSRAKDEWRKARLLEWFGTESTKELSPTDDFEFAMMKFEEIAGGGIRWRMKYASGPARRWTHKIRATCAELDLEEDYARRIARQALKLPTLPLFEELSPRQLQTVLRVIKAQGKRMVATATATEEDGNPF